MGSLPTILYSRGLTFTPAEVDTSIRPGWFWHENDEPHTLEQLFRIYLSSHGSNAALNLNIPPDKHGLFDERDMHRLQEFGQLINREFGTPWNAEIVKKPDFPATQPQYVIHLPKEKGIPKYIVLREKLVKGQRVENFRILANVCNGSQYPLYEGTCIGNRKICVLQNPFADQNPLLNSNQENDIQEIILQITAARESVELREMSVY